MPDKPNLPPRVEQYWIEHGWTQEAVDLFELAWNPQRIAFPVKSWSGEELEGWWERRFDSEPRWLPQGEDFEASKHLFGLKENRIPIAKSNLAILVESPSCVVSLNGLGFPLGLAVCGSALTESQCMHLRRWCDRIIIWADKGTTGSVMVNKTNLTFKEVGGRVVHSFVWEKDPSDAIFKQKDRVRHYLLTILEKIGL